MSLQIVLEQDTLNRLVEAGQSSDLAQLEED